MVKKISEEFVSLGRAERRRRARKAKKEKLRVTKVDLDRARAEEDPEFKNRLKIYCDAHPQYAACDIFGPLPEVPLDEPEPEPVVEPEPEPVVEPEPEPTRIKKLHEYDIDELYILAVEKKDDATLAKIYDNAFYEKGEAKGEPGNDIDGAMGTHNEIRAVDSFLALRYIFGAEPVREGKETAWRLAREKKSREAGPRAEEAWFGLEGLYNLDPNEYDNFGIPWPLLTNPVHTKEEIRNLQLQKHSLLTLVINPDEHIPEMIPSPKGLEPPKEEEPEEPISEKEKEEIIFNVTNKLPTHPRLRISVTDGEYTLEYFEDPLNSRSPVKTELNSEIKRLFGYSDWDTYKKENWTDLTKELKHDNR